MASMPKFKTDSSLTMEEQVARFREILKKQEENLLDIDIELYHDENYLRPKLKEIYEKISAQYAKEVASASRQVKRNLERHPERNIGKYEVDKAKEAYENADAEHKAMKEKVLENIEMLKQLIASMSK